MALSVLLQDVQPRLGNVFLTWPSYLKARRKLLLVGTGFVCRLQGGCPSPWLSTKTSHYVEILCELSSET